jgi:hypothetical protein
MIYIKSWKLYESSISKKELVDKIKYFSQYLETYLNDVNKFTTSSLNLTFSYGTILNITEIFQVAQKLNYDSVDGFIAVVAQQFIIWSEYFTKNDWNGQRFKEKLKSFKFDEEYLNRTDEYKQSNRWELYKQEYNHLLYVYIGETIKQLISGNILDIPELKEFTDKDREFILDSLVSDYDDITTDYIRMASNMIEISQKTLDNSNGYTIRLPLIGNVWNHVKIDYDDDFINRLQSYFSGVLILKDSYSLNQAYYKLYLPFYK